MDLAAGGQKLLVNRMKIIKVLAKHMTEGNSPENVDKPCHQCAVLSVHYHWSSVQVYFILWTHFSGKLRKQCAEPACCGKMQLFLM